MSHSLFVFIHFNHRIYRKKITVQWLELNSNGCTVTRSLVSSRVCLLFTFSLSLNNHYSWGNFGNTSSAEMIVRTSDGILFLFSPFTFCQQVVSFFSLYKLPKLHPPTSIQGEFNHFFLLFLYFVPPPSVLSDIFYFHFYQF